MAEFTNQATLNYLGGAAYSNVTVGRLQEQLGLSKTALRGTYRPGETMTYVLSLVNMGTTALTDLTLRDDLGAYAFNGLTLVPLTAVEGSLLVYVNGVLQAGDVATYAAGLTVTGLTVPAGGNLTLVYEALVNSYAPLGVDGQITNTAVVTGTGLSAPVTASETVAADQAARLTIDKTLDPTVVAAGDTVTYSFQIQNYGAAPVTAADQAAVTDTFTPALQGITVTYNGAAWAAPTNYAYTEATGVFTTVAGQITVPAASFTQDAATGQWTAVPGTAILTVSGAI